MFQVLQVLDRVLHHDLGIRPAGSPDKPIVASDQAGTGTRFGACEMSRVEWFNTGSVQYRCSRRHLRVNPDYDTCTPTPASDFSAAIRQRVLGVLEIQNLRPSQLVQVIGEPLQDGEDGLCLQCDTLLALVIERSVEAIEI
jgi:hypothetical protein